MPSAEQPVLAVLVIHERRLDRVDAWPMLESLTRRRPASTGLRIQRVLVYDNSPRPQVVASELPDWAGYRHDGGNGGTAAAYAAALQEAIARQIPWLLLLDHDTRLPEDLLDRTQQALEAEASPGAVLPRVRHAARPVSPSRITWTGSIRPLAPGDAPVSEDCLTGIASGALVRVEALRQLGPWPRGLWLDYVDHWMFVHLRRAGHRLVVSDAVLQHDLSVADPRSLSPRRLESILDGEALFVGGLGWPARLLQPIRLIARAVRLAPVVPLHAGAILRHLLGRSRRAAP